MRGTYYTIYVGMTMNPDYAFDSLWVSGKRLPVEIKRSASIDTLTLFANEQSGARMPGTDVDPSKSTEAKPPVTSKGAALVGYFYKGQRKYASVPAFEKLKALAYP